MLELEKSLGFNGDTRSMNLTFGHVHTAHHILVSSGGNEVVTRCPYWKVWTEPSQGIRQKGLYFHDLEGRGVACECDFAGDPPLLAENGQPPQNLPVLNSANPPPKKQKMQVLTRGYSLQKRGVLRRPAKYLRWTTPPQNLPLLKKIKKNSKK